MLSALMGTGGGYQQQRPGGGIRSRGVNATRRSTGGENTLDTPASAALDCPPGSTWFASLVDDNDDDDDDDDDMVCCQSNTVGDVAWADLVSAGVIRAQATSPFLLHFISLVLFHSLSLIHSFGSLSHFHSFVPFLALLATLFPGLCDTHTHPDENSGRSAVEGELDVVKRGIDGRYKLICLYIPVATGMLPGCQGGTLWENDNERPSSLSSSQCLLLLAYRIPQPQSDMLNSLQQPQHQQQQYHDEHSVFDSIETQLAIQRRTQEQALTKATDLSIIAGKALLRLAKEFRANAISRVQTSAHALFATPSTSYTKTTTGKHVSAWQCINDIQSAAFASHFNAEQIVVLLSDVYAASLGLLLSSTTSLTPTLN